MKTWPSLGLPTICWYPGEIRPYESIWCVIHKFCRWNQTSTQDVWELLATPCSGYSSIERVLLTEGNLHDPRWLDRSKLQKLARLSDDQIRDSFVQRYCLLPQDQFGIVLGRAELRFCPSCIEGGYHSPLHLLPFIAKCPIHRVELRDACPQCSQPIGYSIPNQGTRPPFACACGHNLWPSGKTIEFRESDTADLVEVVQWLDRVGENTPRLAPLLVRGRSDLPSRREDFVALAARMRDLDPTLKLPDVICDDRVGGEHTFRRSGLRGKRTAPDAGTDVEAVYKSIARQLTRLVQRNSPLMRGGRRFSHASWLAERSQKTRIALRAWRIFWEGTDTALTANPSVLSDGRWRLHFLRRYRDLRGKELRQQSNSMPIDEAWRMNHAVAAACFGTFAECLRRSALYSWVSDAAALAHEVTGELVPFCVSTRGGRDDPSTLHYWWKPEVIDIMRTAGLARKSSGDLSA